MTLALDLYAPKACTAPRPTMVMIHGGGFKTGDRNPPLEGIRRELR